MSGYETIKGIIRKCDRLENENNQEYFKRVTGEELEHSLSIYEAVYDRDLDEKFVNIGDTIYEYIQYINCSDYDSYINMEKLPNGDLSFSTRFYNSGTCVEEMLEEGIESLEI